MPFETVKILGTVVADGTNEALLYTVPAGATARVRVTVSSSDAGTHQFTVSVSPGGAATAAKDKIYNLVDLAKNESFTTTELSLSAGDVIRVKSNAGSGQSTFTFSAQGTEYWTPAPAAYFDVIEGGVQSTVKLYNLEDNLTYVFYTDEDSLVRVGFKGYGPDNELAVNFPSANERSNFVTALENARFYGYGVDGPSSTPIVYLGDNTLLGVSTTTTSTTTTSTSTTTTTTVAPGTTTTTTSTSTTTTTTTAAPPYITIEFARTNGGNSTAVLYFRVSTWSLGNGDETEFYYGPDDLLDNEIEFTGPGWWSDIEEGATKGFKRSFTCEESPDGTYSVGASLESNFGSRYNQLRFYDVTDPSDPVPIALVPPISTSTQGGTAYRDYVSSYTGSQILYEGLVSDDPDLQGAVPMYPGRSYLLVARTWSQST